MNSSKSLLTHDESNAIKGILILLIVLGHTSSFVRLTDSWMVMVWLYLFHIDSFFLLPFLYLSKEVSVKRLWDYIVRLYIPFLWLLLLLMTLNIIYLGWNEISFSIFDFLLAFVGGGAIHLKKIIGVQFPWFLPAMCISCIVRDCYNSSSRISRRIFLVFGIISIGLAFIYDKAGIFGGVCYVILAFQFLFQGVATRFFLENGFVGKRFLLYLFLLGSLCFYLHYRYCLRPFQQGYPNNFFYIFLRLLMAPTFVMLLWNVRGKLIKSKILISLGEKSFPIYLSHAFIGYLVDWILVRICLNDIIGAPVCYTVMVLGSFIVAIGLNKLGRYKSLFMPRTWTDFKNVFIRKTIKG